MQYTINYSCISHIGNVRHINQDNYICDGQYMDKPEKDSLLSGNITSNECSLFGVFDGMGGLENGEVASCLAANAAAKLSLEKDAINVLKAFCENINDEICSYTTENKLSSSGTTAAILAFSRDNIILCNIGDSKIFRFSDGILEQISKDHIAISAFGVKPPLSQHLGIPRTEMEIDPYLAQGTYTGGDVYLICSDGLTDMVTTEDIVSILASSANMEIASKALLNEALANGGKDNITIILCQIECKASWLSNLKFRFSKKMKERKKI